MTERGSAEVLAIFNFERLIMKTILASFVAIVALAWGIELLSPDHTAAGSLPWAIYLESLFLTGLFSISLMSLAMVLATRPVWLERPLGGMDRIYRLHKWSGILAVVFAASHWLLEMSDDFFKALAGHGDRVKEDELSAFAEPLRDMGEALGEWAFYVLLALLALTLWKRFSYRLWRPLHRAMPVLYLLLIIPWCSLPPVTGTSPLDCCWRCCSAREVSPACCRLEVSSVASVVLAAAWSQCTTQATISSK